MQQVHYLRVSRCLQDGLSDVTVAPHHSLEPLLELVDEQTRRDVGKYRFLRDARRCLLGRLLARYVTTTRLDAAWESLGFAKTAHGRPYLAQPSQIDANALFDYNVSHDSDIVAIASVLGTTSTASLAVGIDVMCHRNPWEGSSVTEFLDGIGEQLTVAEEYAIASCINDDARLRHALALWTLKEAYAKATGEGLHLDLQRLSFDLEFASASIGPIGLGRLDGALLQGWRFELVDLPIVVQEEAGGKEQQYWLATAVRDAQGRGEVVLRRERPDWMNEVRLEAVLEAAKR